MTSPASKYLASTASTLNAAAYEALEPESTLPEQWLGGVKETSLLPENKMQMAGIRDAMRFLHRAASQSRPLTAKQTIELIETDAWVNEPVGSCRPLSLEAILYHVGQSTGTSPDLEKARRELNVLVKRAWRIRRKPSWKPKPT